MESKNQAILALLKQNARLSWQQIGKQVYLTGQAVAARVQQMEELGVITGYTLKTDQRTRYFITMFMENPNFAAFEQYLAAEPAVESAFKISGEGCYQITFLPVSVAALEPFLNILLKYGKYKVATSLRCVKA